jgi:hypothetical protein
MYPLELLKANRRKFFALVDDLSAEEINKIPAGFNNNIAWNIGHAVVAAYSLAYVRSGVNASIQIPFADKYKGGTKPEQFVSKDEIESLKKASDDFFVQIEKDLSENKFHHVEPFAPKTLGIEAKTIEEYLITIYGHDVLHCATASAQKRMVTEK